MRGLNKPDFDWNSIKTFPFHSAHFDALMRQSYKDSSIKKAAVSKKFVFDTIADITHFFVKATCKQ